MLNKSKYQAIIILLSEDRDYSFISELLGVYEITVRIINHLHASKITHLRRARLSQKGRKYA
jgi:hypothetical protein